MGRMAGGTLYPPDRIFDSRSAAAGILSSVFKTKKGATPLGNRNYRATICCAVASSPMAMAITMPPPDGAANKLG